MQPPFYPPITQMWKSLIRKSQQYITRLTQKPNVSPKPKYSFLQKLKITSKPTQNSDTFLNKSKSILSSGLSTGRNLYQKTKDVIEKPKRLKRKFKIYSIIVLILVFLYLIRPFVNLLNVLLQKQNKQ